MLITEFPRRLIDTACPGSLLDLYGRDSELHRPEQATLRRFPARPLEQRIFFKKYIFEIHL